MEKLGKHGKCTLLKYRDAIKVNFYQNKIMSEGTQENHLVSYPNKKSFGVKFKEANEEVICLLRSWKCAGFPVSPRILITEGLHPVEPWAQGLSYSRIPTNSIGSG